MHRRRCECGKVVYPTKDEAYYAIRTIPLHRGYCFLKPYRCPLLVKGWHVGHDHKMYQAFQSASLPAPGRRSTIWTEKSTGAV